MWQFSWSLRFSMWNVLCQWFGCYTGCPLLSKPNSECWWWHLKLYTAQNQYTSRTIYTHLFCMFLQSEEDLKIPLPSDGSNGDKCRVFSLWPLEPAAGRWESSHFSEWFLLVFEDPFFCLALSALIIFKIAFILILCFNCVLLYTALGI